LAPLVRKRQPGVGAALAVGRVRGAAVGPRDDVDDGEAQAGADAWLALPDQRR
jgi:hypothetical protein